MRQKCSYDHSHKRVRSVFGLSRQRRQHGESRDPVDRTRVLGRSERMSDRSENISVRWDVPSAWTDHSFEALKMFSVRSVDTSEQVNCDVRAVRRHIQTGWKRCRTGQSVHSWRWRNRRAIGNSGLWRQRPRSMAIETSPSALCRVCHDGFRFDGKRSARDTTSDKRAVMTTIVCARAICLAFKMCA